MKRYLSGLVLLSLAVVVATAATSGTTSIAGSGDKKPAEAAAEADGPKQIIKNEEMMKLLFDPYYVDLRKAIREEPTNRAEWRRAYIAIFRLTEVTNLLYSRGDKEYMHTPEWRKMATQSRDAAQAVGQAVLKRDYPLIRQRYETLIGTCNACHKKFEPTEATEVQVW